MNKPGFKRRLEAILWKKYNKKKKSEALVDIKTSVRINKSDMNLIKEK